MNELMTTVMIVDDEEMVVGSIQSFLELETSYRVLPFTSPEAALASLDDDGPVEVRVAPSDGRPLVLIFGSYT